RAAHPGLVAEDLTERVQRIAHASAEELAHHVAEELARHVLEIGAILPLRHDGLESLDLLLTGGVHLVHIAHLGLQLRQLAGGVRDADLIGSGRRRRPGGPGRRLDCPHRAHSGREAFPVVDLHRPRLTLPGRSPTAVSAALGPGLRAPSPMLWTMPRGSRSAMA